jgi:hypothetical protein
MIYSIMYLDASGTMTFDRRFLLSARGLFGLAGCKGAMPA